MSEVFVDGGQRDSPAQREVEISRVVGAQTGRASEGQNNRFADVGLPVVKARNVRLAVRPVRPTDPHHFLVRDAGQEVGHGDIGPEVGAVAPGAQPRVELGQRLQHEAPLLEAGMRDDQVQVHVGHAQPVEGQDVQVHGAGAEALSGGLAAERNLQPLQVGEQVTREDVRLQLQGGVGEDRLVKEVAGRRLVQARDADDLPNAFQLAYGADKGLTRVAQIAPQTDEGAHALGLYPMQVPELARRLQSDTCMEPMQFSRMEKALIMAAFLPFLAIGLLVLFA